MDSQRETGALLIAACIIAAIRLRGEPIRPSPKLTATVAEAIALGRTVLSERVEAQHSLTINQQLTDVIRERFSERSVKSRSAARLT